MRPVLQISSTNSIAPKGLGLSHKHEIRCIPNFKKNGLVHCQGGSHPGSSPNRKAERRVELTVKDPVPYKGSSYASLAQAQEGIGIVEFLKGKVFFITGATGFFAKALIEKLLRSVPEVGKIYVMIKANNEEVALKRLKNEIINSEIFKCLGEIHGKSYEGFMLSKLIPVGGNISESNLGLDENSATLIAQDVHVIVNSAANTNFHERYDVAFDINTMGPCRVMAFAKICKKLNLFLQISTAYVNGERQGRVMERAFREGETISIIDGDNPIPPLDIDVELTLTQRLSEETNTAQKIKELGLERARKYGWQDPYVFTKAMGEMLLGRMRGNVPVVIVRPSIIESTYRDPFPGWIQGNRMMDPFLIQYGKGQLPGFPADRSGVLDVVPVDMVVNATLAAIAKHGMTRTLPEISVYQVTSSAVNPFTMGEFADFCHDHFIRSPYLDVQGRPVHVEPFRFFESMDDFSSHILCETRRRIKSSNDPSPSNQRKIESVCRKVMGHAKNLASVYGPYIFYGGTFDNSNTSLLMEGMSEEERETFCFDVRSIDWKDYICNMHIPGLRRHVMMKESSRATA